MDVNSKEKIEEMIKDYREAKRNRRMTGVQHMIDSEVVPDWTDMLEDESSHDGNLLVEWNFMQNYSMSKYRCDNDRKEVTYDLCGDKNHVYNQTDGDQNHDDRM